jgi:hypothetical protein
VKTRIYEVAPTNWHGDGNGISLIDATSMSQAISHRVRRAFVVTIAKPKRVAELMDSGVKVETATAE